MDPISILIFILVLSVLVFVHEFGHFIVAKLSGIKVEEFGIGFPPKILSFRRGETVYSINLIPFGGFVRLYGEDEHGVSKKDPEQHRMFIHKPILSKVGVVVAGVAMNFIFAVVAFSIIYSIMGIPRPFGEVRITQISPNSPAEKAGITTSEAIIAINGKKIESSMELISIVGQKADQEIKVSLRNLQDGNVREVAVTPEKDGDHGRLGVGIQDVEVYYPPVWQRPFYGAVYGVQEAFMWSKQTILGLGTIFTSISQERKIPEGVAGPVGIYDISKSVCQQGVLSCLNFMGILSVNLAVLNLLPLSPLDGGKLVFVAIEAALRGRAQSARLRVERAVLIVGTILLLLFIFAVTRQDILRLLR